LFTALKKSPEATLEVRTEPNLPPVIGDTSQMGQVLLNFSRTACTRRGGEAP
jgi:nitrogen-specific signal transduction histidine kinase